MTVQVFISWTGDSLIPLGFKELLENSTQSMIKGWCSADPLCLPHGTDSPAKIKEAIHESKLCIAIINKSQIKNWWINYETGCFAGQNKPIYAILYDGLTHNALQNENHPLGVYGTNCTYLEKASFESLFLSIILHLKSNNLIDKAVLQDQHVRKSIATNFKSFNKIVQKSILNTKKEPPDIDTILSED